MDERDPGLESAAELYDDAPCGYLSTSPDGMFVRLNRTFLSWTGYSPEELVKRRRLQDLLTVSGKVYYETHVAPLLRMHGEVREIQLELQCRNGRTLPVLLNTVQKKDESGRLVLLRSTLFDITDRKRYERELLAAKQIAERRSEQAALGLAISRALSGQLEQPAQLQLCAEALVDHLDLSEVRLWGADPADPTVLHLWASAGVFSASGDAAPAHPPEREARAALERSAALARGPEHLRPSDEEEWLKRENVSQFLALPLLAGERFFGVLAVYARSELDAPTQQALSVSANELAVGMERSWAEREREALVGRLRAQTQALQESREWLETTLRSIGDAVIATDAQARITFLNPVAEELTGWRTDEAIGKPLAEIFRIINETTRAPVPSPIEVALRECKVVGVANHTLLVRRDGSEIAIDDSAAPIQFSGGDAMGAVLVFRDVTAQRERERALLTAREQLSTVVRNAPVILFSVDRVGRIQLSEGQGLLTLGLDPRDRVGRSVFEEYANVPWMIAEFRRALAGERLVGGGDLKGRVLQTHYTPMFDRYEQVIGVVGLVLDVTERRRYEETIRKTVEFEQQLLGIVSHDLRNPISAILLGTSLLLSRGDALDDKTLRAVSRIRSSGERAHRLIRDLLDFTQARLGGRIPIESAPVDLSVLVPLVLEEVEVGHPDRTVTLKTEGALQGEWDGDRLAQVVTNLTVNALKYSPAGTPITVTLRDEGDEVSFEVHNLGAPIPHEARDKLFLPMRRAAAHVDSRGRSVGLGLFIVKQLVEAHGGTVEVRSDESVGTIFRVVLPRFAGAPRLPASAGH